MKNEDDHLGAREDEVQRIVAIKSDETLGYQGAAKEEHTGEPAESQPDDPTEDLADNRPEDV
jgi:hypothetical protein